QYKDAKTLFKAIQARFSGNDATKKTQRTLLKQIYMNFNAPIIESLDSIFNRLQKIVSQLAILVSAVSTPVNTVSSPDNTANLSDATVYAFLANQPNESQLVHEDLEQIHEDDLEEMDLKWQLALLSMRARSTSRQSSSRETTPVSAARPINTVVSKLLVNVAKPRSNSFQKSHSLSRRPFYQQTALKNRNLNNNVNAAKANSVNAAMANFFNTAKGNKVTSAVRNQETNTVKSSACWFGDLKLQSKIMSLKILDHIFGTPQDALKDQGYFESECSRHMTGIISFLTDFKEHDGGMLPLGEELKVVRLLAKAPSELNIVPQKDLTCLLAKATNYESMLWHRRLGDINFKNINKLVKDNLVRGLPSKHFKNDQTCVACLKGKQRKVSFKSKLQNSISQPLFMLHMDLFGPTSVSSIMHKKYCLVITDDFSRFTWVFFLATKDETSRILNSFITEIENLVGKKVKIIWCDNITEFKNKVMNEFCKEKDSKLPTTFWAEAVSTACYVQNRVVVKPHFKTHYELLKGNGASFDASQSSIETESGQNYILMPLWKDNSIFDNSSQASDSHNKDKHDPSQASESDNHKRPNVKSSTKTVNTVGPVNTATPTYVDSSNDPLMPDLEDARIFDDAYDDRDEGAEADYNNLEIVISMEPKKIYLLEKEPLETNGSIEIREMKEGLLSDIMPGCVKLASTPMETHKPLSKDAAGTDVDVYLYGSMIGSLMYLTSSRPDIMFVVCVCSRFQVQPKVSHMHAMKRIFRYLKGQPTLGLWYPKDSPLGLIAYSNSDYAGASLDKKSTIGEYIVASNCYGQVLWIQNQLLYYGYNFMQTKIHVDNESAICVVKNPVYHSKTKHIEIRHHFIRDSYEKRLIEMVKIHTDYNVEDLLTKAFDVTRMGCKSGQVMKMGFKLKGYLINDGYADLVQHADKKELAIPGQTTTSKELSNPLMAGSLPKTTLPTKLNLMAYLEKPIKSEGFIQIIDFLNESSVKYDLTLSLTIYTSCIKQFWTSAKVKTVNDEVQIQALVDGKRVDIKESLIRRILRLDDAEGTSCLTNTKIFEGLARMGYENPSDKLTFYKSFFSPQWKFLIHTILQCLSAKTTSWNEFSSTMAYAIIYLATNQKFNFSRYNLLSLVKNIEAGVPFFMFPRFVQVIINRQLGDMTHHKDIFATPLLTKNVFSNMKRKKHKPKRKHTKEPEVPPTESQAKHIIPLPSPSHDPLPSAEAYNLDLDHQEKVLSMLDVNDEEPADVKEVLEVVKFAKLITKVVTTTGVNVSAASVQDTLITAAEATKVIVPRKRRVMKYQALKRKPLTEAQARRNMIVYLKNMVGYKMNYFKGISYDEIRPLFEKHYNYNQAFLTEVNEGIKVTEPYFKIIRADGNHRLFLSFSTMLKNFDREDLESL
nr:hypothetical protein [Tanacetum cinerariifolium]